MPPIHGEPWPALPVSKVTGIFPRSVGRVQKVRELPNDFSQCVLQKRELRSVKPAQRLGIVLNMPGDIGTGPWSEILWLFMRGREREKTSGARADRVIKSPAGSAIRGVFDATRGSWGTGMKVYVSDKYLRIFNLSMR